LEEAATLVQDGLDRLPHFASGHLVASRVARDCGDLLAAREHLDRVLDLDPENVLALLERADARASEADAEGAALYLRAALELEPGNEAAVRRLSDLEDSRWAALVRDEPAPPQGVKISEEAPAELDAVDSALPEPVVAESSSTESNPRTAVHEGEDGNDPFASEEADEDAFLTTRTMAELYVKQGLLERAIEVYRQVRDASPGDSGLADRLRELEAQAGESSGGQREVGSHVAAAVEAKTVHDFEEPDDAEEVEEVEEVGELRIKAEAVVVAPPVPSSHPLNPAPVPLAPSRADRTISDYLRDLLAWVPGAVPISALAPDGLEGASISPVTPVEGEPDVEAATGGGARDSRDSDDFDAWLRSLRP
jgi:tetratricopeptide (TPR) repeat protein